MNSTLGSVVPLAMFQLSFKAVDDFYISNLTSAFPQLRLFLRVTGRVENVDMFEVSSCQFQHVDIVFFEYCKSQWLPSVESFVPLSSQLILTKYFSSFFHLISFQRSIQFLFFITLLSKKSPGFLINAFTLLCYIWVSLFFPVCLF